MITAECSAMDINASVTKTRLYQNLTDYASVMGFYDVKNAKLCCVFEGQGLTHREPALDEQDFTLPEVPGTADGRWTGRAAGADGPRAVEPTKIQKIFVANKFRT
eukprot:7480592-Pyramimonas_sp.AAC.1